MATVISKVQAKIDQGAPLYEIVVLLMEEAEKISSLNGEGKQDYVINTLITECKIDADPETIKSIIKLSIDITHGLYNINNNSSKKTFLSLLCF